MGLGNGKTGKPGPEFGNSEPQSELELKPEAKGDRNLIRMELYVVITVAYRGICTGLPRAPILNPIIDITPPDSSYSLSTHLCIYTYVCTHTDIRGYLRLTSLPLEIII